MFLWSEVTNLMSMSVRDMEAFGGGAAGSNDRSLRSQSCVASP
jgi:hypothetical protein